MLLVVSLWSWNQSSCHFNPGLTFGEMSLDLNNRKKRISFIVIIIVQLLGGLLGVAFTAILTYTKDIDSDSDLNLKIV